MIIWPQLPIKSGKIYKLTTQAIATSGGGGGGGGGGNEYRAFQQSSGTTAQLISTLGKVIKSFSVGYVTFWLAGAANYQVNRDEVNSKTVRLIKRYNDNAGNNFDHIVDEIITTASEVTVTFPSRSSGKNAGGKNDEFVIQFVSGAAQADMTMLVS